MCVIVLGTVLQWLELTCTAMLHLQSTTEKLAEKKYIILSVKPFELN